MASATAPDPLIPEHEPWYSRLTFSFMNRIVAKGLRQTLEYEDLQDLPEDMQYTNMFPKFKAFYELKRKENPNYTMGSALISFLKWDLFMQALLVIISNLFDIAVPLQIKFFIAWISDPNGTWWLGLIWAGGITLGYTLKLNIGRRSWIKSSILQYSVGCLLRGAIFWKLTKTSREGLANINLGLVTLIMNHDTFKIQNMLRLINYVYTVPLISIAGFAYFYYYFNWLAVFFPVFTLVWMTVVSIISRFLYKYQQKVLQFSDKRSKLTTECLASIKSIKFECWEDNVIDKLAHFRRNESSNLSKYFFLRNFMNGFTELFSPAFLLFFISVYTYVYSPIAIDKAYLLISLSSMLLLPLKASVSLVDSFTSSQLAFKRLNLIMGIPEVLDPPCDTSLPVGTVLVHDLSTGWHSPEIVKYFQTKDDPDKICIKHVNYRFLPAHMYGVVGKVGSGKTAFLNSILGDMATKSGSVRRNGRFAFVPQTPFLLNASIRDNILFGEPFDRERYKSAVIKCRLLDDFKVLAAGDSTEVGERGVNLSGGQKQRISLARALYANKDIYLIDDTLSALDSQVAKSVFRDVILGEFKSKGKTVILVTHALSVLSECDQVVVLDKGEISLSGPFETIKKDPIYLDYAKSSNPRECDAEDGQDGVPEENEKATVEEKQHSGALEYDLEVEMRELEELMATKETKKQMEEQGKLTKKEEKQSGRVGGIVYWRYAQNFGLGFFFSSFGLFLSYMSFRNLSDYWIGYWASDRWGWTQDNYRYVYIFFVGGMLLMVVIRAVLLSLGMGNVGFNFNKSMMTKVFQRPVSYFESTPIGVIINRCTKELLDLDLIFNNYLQNVMANTCQMISMVVVLCITVPFMVIMFGLVIYLLLRILRTSTIVTSDVKRITQVSTAPVISSVAEMYSGMTIVKGFDKVEALKLKFDDQIFRMLKSDGHERFLENWMFWRIEAVSSLIVLSTAFFIYLIKQADITAFNSVTSLSLAISWAAISGDFIGFCLMTVAEFMKGMNSVERMLEVAESTDVEPCHTSPTPPKNWPQSSKIELRNVKMKYRPNLPLVLDNINLVVEPNQKVGIVGRTGSGKSSLILALMRIVEIEKKSPLQQTGSQDSISPEEVKISEQNGDGMILLDGVNTRELGLRYARSAITLIPQDAFVLSGTIRSNIDPFDKHKDDEILEVLRKTKLLDSLVENYSRKINSKDSPEAKNAQSQQTATKITGLKEGENLFSHIINMPIEAGGSNLSQGQRQLLSIARALMKKPKVLLMDEATASIDSKTDEIIQGVLKSEFKDSTIITIAHRLNTIIQYDRILSLKSGQVVEFGEPSTLLRTENSYLSELVRQNGEEFFREMLGLADQAKLARQHIVQ